ncbi:MAG: Hsp20 family protein [Alphaproteobacteria bacterium]|nr:heat-shock protein Hsp20 [Rhodobiaceae bacterium]MBO6544239.1 Hsp20 family protein [Alphaproteobacteria bacterium]MBO6627647.1 Hsp20 family protein [Alphaproteobacteria bacterium]MDF1628129.1 Hsp20 family protein [Parvibaculaceae bacterium]
MTRMARFDSPFLLGFEQVERLLDRVARSGPEGYPPYNVEEVEVGKGARLRITLAVAGFTPDDLSVTVEGNQLIIRGRQTEEAERAFLHRGIAARQFQRAFVLAEGIKVEGADLENGLLTISLEQPEPTESVQQIEIRTK